MNHSLKILIVTGIVFSSCMVSKPYQKPSITTPAAFRGQISSDTNTIAAIGWKSFFTDEFLQKHIQSALDNNFDLLIAMENMRIANHYLAQSKANFLPSINASVEPGYLTPSLNSLQGMALSKREWFENHTVSVSASWELDIWQKLKSQKKAAQASYLQSVAAQQAIKTQLISSVAINYYLLLMYDSQRETLNKTIANRVQSVQTIKALKNAGSVTEVGVKQTEAQLYTAQALLIDIENQIKIYENALSLLEGVAPTEISRTSVANLKEMDAGIVSAGVPIQLLSNRPDVLASEQNLLYAFQMKHVAEASLYPTLSIGASGGLNGSNFVNLFSASSFFANIVGSLTQPILNRKVLKTNVAVSKNKQQIALLNYQKSVLNAYREVSNALYTYKASVDKEVVVKKENEALVAAVNFSEQLEIQGMASYLEVLRAKDNALSTELTIAQTAFSKVSALVQLYSALGGGSK